MFFHKFGIRGLRAMTTGAYRANNHVECYDKFFIQRLSRSHEYQRHFDGFLTIFLNLTQNLHK